VQVALVMVKADGSSRELSLDKASTLIGRDEGAKLRIPVPAVSRRHCEVLVSATGVSIKDLGSSNGTYVNGKKTREASLSPGDLITVGPVVFVVKINGDPSKIDAKDCYAAGTVGLEDDDDDDLPIGNARPGAAKPGTSPGSKQPPTTIGKPSVFDDDDEGGDLKDLLKDLNFDDDDDEPKKK
jgi:predicted component of type VI protein secretion system